MGGRRAGETGVAAAGGVEVREVGGRVREEGAADEVADAAGLEGGGGLEVFEFEEDAAAGGRGVLVSGVEKGRRRVMGVCTILQLWRERRTRSEGSRPRVWGGRGVVDSP